MRVTIHQPEHMPWLGFFHKMSSADCLVILDNVQFRKNYFQNRNKVRISTGSAWITVPVTHDSATLIKDVAIAADLRWKKKWSETIYFSYRKTRFFDSYFEAFQQLVQKDWTGLSDLNVELIKLLCKYLNIRTRLTLASEIAGHGKGSDLILDIARKIGAREYVSGISGKTYLRTEDFEKENIIVHFQEFHHPIYSQLYEPFLPCMSAVDLLFNHGEKSGDILRGLGVPLIQEVFT